MGNQQGHELSQAEIGRRPNDAEVMILFQLQTKLFTRLVLSPEHLALLQRYWEAHFVNKAKTPKFERIGPFWCTEGGFTSENPGEDLRSMGELGLQCLVFFVEQYPGESKMMKRAKGGYPFAKAAMAVARAICEAMHLVDEEGNQGKFPVVETLYWQILEDVDSFYRLFSLCFLVFEELYCDELARDRTLPVTERIPTSVIAKLVDATKSKLMGALKKAPMKLSVLHTLCINGSLILNQPTANPPVRKGLRQRSVSLPQVTSSTSTLQTNSRWLQHQTNRKSMRDAVKSWDQPNGVAPRLVPRAPEIAFKSSEATEGDLFAGLVTKQPAEPLDPLADVARAS
ncbi:hypothetical protein Poli38472_009958 [Pythium oligandrum]|uniref:ELMO domain-containing protein n=1 Tax=Pythium oligandrum TaxID=41045 RepID=A0A8K1C8G7_PYTOL|nr:hypothetical protein Poli38472_009958 [Pythium oligandrum]|eukprot:TMW58399.1 hypothetical protein Poli38472_009958 [Pythium oligandrum]